jgi:hypothetical protein
MSLVGVLQLNESSLIDELLCSIRTKKNLMFLIDDDDDFMQQMIFNELVVT